MNSVGMGVYTFLVWIGIHLGPDWCQSGTGLSVVLVGMDLGLDWYGSQCCPGLGWYGFWSHFGFFAGVSLGLI